ncbi:protein COFACTOR ASSEMBLY OF COMPLEX C SUBUNIT B CCB3, chloroplastic isoform X2 [Hevea brasiliensis]|uniref:protein COFACTOR ASSEMBLY OF COMPLEX C SUBUNIT B CCB3, chloroplastic isoform X2 n=1 Tax=Hevea brasiliensis TaxID=3981 RepID=UPI0025E24481|nr:protein COFACTOR ASSEMBLY OF COMPLEX C SUBUNIT B CCB3, chloroplastic isoform X2 [Hevea brasiliensis]
MSYGNFERFMCPTRGKPSEGYQVSRSSMHCSAINIEQLPTYATISDRPSNGVEDVRSINLNVLEASKATSKFIQSLTLADLDPATAKLAIGILGPFLSAFGFLFILRIVMSWYPKLPVGKFPYIIAYAPTEPILIPTRKVIPPVGGVDVTPVVWFGLISFLNEILVGPQGLLVLLSQQVN